MCEILKHNNILFMEAMYFFIKGLCILHMPFLLLGNSIFELDQRHVIAPEVSLYGIANADV